MADFGVQRVQKPIADFEIHLETVELELNPFHWYTVSQDCAESAPEPCIPAAQPQERGSVNRVEFAQFYEQHMAKLVRHLMRQGANSHEAAEAAQAAFAEAFVRWEIIEYPASWLRLVAIRMYWRQPARREDLTHDFPDLPGGICPVRSVELKEEEVRVYAAFGALPHQRRAVLAWHLDGFPAKEIGAVLDMTQEAVRKNLSRGRARLKEILLNATDGGGR
ncbi:sigma-70 family RNA polymerase sigma factor [Streptomyces sp. NPDC021098]|uniref:sigma-70 family RNA polymerase sigma factor n=1 Tax=unclassified Streptomyces TaxID=2593676 RepID=UPI0037A3FBDF